MNAPIYLDYNATAKVRPEAITAVGDALLRGGNPSSVHAAGRAARGAMEAARAEIAALVGAGSGNLTFTSGGTEASGMAIASAVASGVRRVIVGATEHDCVKAEAQDSGLPVEVWPVDAKGVADLDWLAERLADGPRALVCLMLANNETGVIQPVAAAATLVRRAGGWLHVDAIQAAGKIGLDFEALGADTLALSAHKLGGPQGVGALVAGPRATLTRQLHGGGQERGVRAGTENVAGAAGFGAAARAAREDLSSLQRQTAWRDALAARMIGADAVVIGESAPRLPQTLCVATPDFAADIQVMSMDLAGVMISAGSACSSGKVKASAVVTSMGRDDLAPFAVRVSGGWGSTEADWVRCGDVWLDLLHRHRRRREAA